MTTSAQPVANSDQGAPSWHDAAHGQLVQTKGWKGWADTVRDYAQLESHVGAPPENLIRIPAADKLDDAFRADVFKRIGYNPSRAPEKPEDYGVKFEGAPDGFDLELSKLAHKHGLPKEALAEFAELNTRFGKAHGEKLAAAQKTADDARWTDRHGFVDGKLKERFGEKHAEMTERMTREAVRLGFKDEADVEAFERSLALGGDEDLLRFRSLLADVAEARREAPLHKGGGGATMTPADAQAKLDANMKNGEWVSKALTRGTPEAAENLRLNAIISGKQLSDEELTRLAKGLTAQAGA